MKTSRQVKKESERINQKTRIIKVISIAKKGEERIHKQKTVKFIN